MAFNATQTITLKATAYSIHNLLTTIDRLYGIGLMCEGESNANTVGHDIYNTIDRLTDLFLFTCDIPTTKDMLLDPNTELDDETISSFTNELIAFANTEINDTSIIEFATSLRNRATALRKEK